MAKSRQGIYGTADFFSHRRRKLVKEGPKTPNLRQPLVTKQRRSTEDKENNSKERFGALFSCVNRKKSQI